MKVPDLFALKFGNIPLINLRIEFNRTYLFIRSQEAETCLKPPIEPIRAPMFVWGGMPDDLMTLLLQRAILGVEASYYEKALDLVAHSKTFAGQFESLEERSIRSVYDAFSFSNQELAVQTRAIRRVPI